LVYWQLAYQAFYFQKKFLTQHLILFQNQIKEYPAIANELVYDVVGASHFNLERIKELVDKRPELALACWDWRFGDFETAIGAASHDGTKLQTSHNR